MSQSSKSPRPILKRTHSDERRHSPPYPHGVRFPPSPALARTFDAYSSSTYDRSPIEVSRNTCALPERGCPGRTYDIDDPSFSKSVKKTVTSRGAHAHPRLLHSTSSPSYYSESISNPSSSSLPPPLILDLSSESEESDGFIGPPPHTSFSRRSSISPSSRIDKYPSSCTYHPEMMSSSPSEIKVRIRRSSRERGERIRSSPILERQDIDDPGYEDRLEFSSHCSPPSPNTRSKKHRTRKNISALTQSMSTFNMQDDAGCLGGF